MDENAVHDVLDDVVKVVAAITVPK